MNIKGLNIDFRNYWKRKFYEMSVLITDFVNSFQYGVSKVKYKNEWIYIDKKGMEYVDY